MRQQKILTTKRKKNLKIKTRFELIKNKKRIRNILKNTKRRKEKKIIIVEWIKKKISSGSNAIRKKTKKEQFYDTNCPKINPTRGKKRSSQMNRKEFFNEKLWSVEVLADVEKSNQKQF